MVSAGASEATPAVPSSILGRGIRLYILGHSVFVYVCIWRGILGATEILSVNQKVLLLPAKSEK